MNIVKLLQLATHRGDPAHLFIALLSIVALAGCTSTPTSPMRISDNRVNQPSIRMSVNLDDEQTNAPESKTFHAIEFGYMKAKGGSDQALAEGQPPIIFNHTAFDAPQQIRNNFDIRFADISFRMRKFFLERSLGLELAAGFGQASLGLTVTSPTQDTSSRIVNYGPQGGAAIIWRFLPGTSFHMRASGFYSPEFNFSRKEIFLMQGIGQNLSLYGGYAQSHVEDTSFIFEQNSFLMDFSGPMLGVGFNF